jgi:hypothetical protein
MLMLPLVEIRSLTDADAPVWHMVFINQRWEFQIENEDGNLHTFERLIEEVMILDNVAVGKGAKFFVLVDEYLDDGDNWEIEQGSPAQLFDYLELHRIPYFRSKNVHFLLETEPFASSDGMWELRLNNGQRDYLTYIFTATDVSAAEAKLKLALSNPNYFAAHIQDLDIHFEVFDKLKAKFPDRDLNFYSWGQLGMMMYSLLGKVRSYGFDK